MDAEHPIAPNLEKLLLLVRSQPRFLLQSTFLHSLSNAALQESFLLWCSVIADRATQGISKMLLKRAELLDLIFLSMRNQSAFEATSN